MSIGNRIKEARRWRGISQIGLGFKINYSVSMISAFENGRAMPGIMTLIDLSKTLNVPILWLLQDELKKEGAVDVQESGTL